MLLLVYGFFVYQHFQTRSNVKYTAPEARFRAESIHTSPVIIGHKLTKLFKLLQLHSQRERTIVNKLCVKDVGESDR